MELEDVKRRSTTHFHLNEKFHKKVIKKIKKRIELIWGLPKVIESTITRIQICIYLRKRNEHKRKKNNKMRRFYKNKLVDCFGYMNIQIRKN